MDLTREGRNWFTNAERAWLADWVPEFSSLQGNRKAEGDSASQMKRFQTRLVNEFDSKFPYRHPRNAKAKGLSKEERQLVCDEQEWTTMGQRFRDWLQKRKSSQVKTPPKTSAEPTAGTKKRVSFIDSHLNVYAQGGSMLRTAQAALQNVIQESNYSWAEVEPSELQSCQDNLSSDLQDILRLLSHTTGAEFLVVGIWRDAEEWNCTRICSPRAAAFMREDTIDVCTNGFLDFLANYIGPNLQTTVDLAAPAVHADSAPSCRPKLPPKSQVARHNERAMKEWLSALWAWQGGKLPVPWALLEADSIETKRFCLVEQKRLPSGLPGIRCPDDWTEQEADIWFDHCEDETDPDKAFQFLQPRPGLYELQFRTERHPEATHIYSAESLAYALRCFRAKQDSVPLSRDDELPMIQPNSIYAPFLPGILSDLQRELPAEDPCMTLANLVNDHEHLGPHALDITSWEEQIVSCPHIRKDTPPEEAGLEHFNTTDSFLLKEFFIYGSSDAYPYSLGRCVEWVQPSQWYHSESCTIEGGPYGCKWPILLILHIRLNMEWARKGRFPPYHGEGIQVEFLKCDWDQLDGVMRAWLEALQDSMEELGKSVEQRRGGRAADLGSVPFESPRFEDLLALNSDEKNVDWTAPGVSPMTFDEYKARSQEQQQQRSRRKRSAPPLEHQAKRAKSDSESSKMSTPVGGKYTQGSWKTDKFKRAGEEEKPALRRSGRTTRSTKQARRMSESEEEEESEEENEEENEEDELHDEEADSDNNELEEEDQDVTVQVPRSGKARRNK